jgi:transposase
MVRNLHLSKSILDSGWGLFKQYLTYKAANAGREIRLVNPAYTSKCCSSCGATFQDFSLSTRWVECDCGLSLDRDRNAALNILHKAGWDTSVVANVSHQAKRRTRSPRQQAEEVLTALAEADKWITRSGAQWRENMGTGMQFTNALRVGARRACGMT